MSEFEFALSLFGLLLGLALTEGLSGLAKALKSHPKFRIGWPTALLGIFVCCDVVTFWMYGWSLRERLVVSWPMLFGGFILSAIYYVSASLIFPDDSAADLDGHFDKYRRIVIGGIFICNAALMVIIASQMQLPAISSLRIVIQVWSFFPVALLAIFTNSRRVAVACLAWLILLYPLSAVWI